MKLSKHILGVVCLALPLMGFAQAVIGASETPVTPQVDKRQANQDTRIQNAINGGQLSTVEANRLDRGQQRIHNYEERVSADGVVTTEERKNLRRAERHQSRKIREQSNDRQIAR